MYDCNVVINLKYIKKRNYKYSKYSLFLYLNLRIIFYSFFFYYYYYYHLIIIIIIIIINYYFI
ncbi:hypothetical protein GLOIN_2v1537781, partial [Rhizophagus irregularis DAOM 181602=DAOM 197198]